MAFLHRSEASKLQELEDKRIKKEHEEHKKAQINSIIEDLRNNTISELGTEILSDSTYILYIEEAYDILRQIRNHVPYTRMLIYKGKRSQRTICEGEINKISIYYYTDECCPQPPIEPLPQHTNVTCCALL